MVLLLKKLSFGIAVCLTLGMTAIPSHADATTLRVTTPPTEVVIGGPGGGTKSFTVELLVSGTQDSEITADFIDFIYGADGKKENLKAGSTPYSLAEVLTIEDFDGTFKAKEKTKSIQIKINTKRSKIDEMFYGGFVVQAVPVVKNPSKKQISTASTSSGIISQINVVPYGFAGGKNKDKILPADFTHISIAAKGRSSAIDYLIPDLPGLINSGPIEARVDYKNSGKLPVFVSTNWTFSYGGKQIASRSNGRTMLRAGKSASRASITQAKVEGTDTLTNVLPPFGLVEIQTSLTSDIAGTKFDPVVNKSSVFILQWKEPFFFIALGLTFVWYVLRRRPSTDGKKRKEPSLAWLAIKALRKYLSRRFARSPETS